METKFNSDERKRIQQGIKEKYKLVAINPEGKFRYPTGRAGLEGQKYDPEILRALPEDVLASYCGVGNPFSLGPVIKGGAVLDIGCGAGVDTFVAAIMVGPEGRVIGIDLISEMLNRARTNLEKTSFKNVTFQEGSAEELPFLDRIFDVVISNGVFNLITDKAKALKEVFRVMKSSGRFLLADQILTGDMPADSKSMVENWAR
jgi:SAM-dependent methyltransferase